LENFVPPKAHPKDAEELLRELFRQNLLTKFQAQQVAAGRTKSLILGNYTILDKIGAGGMGREIHDVVDAMNRALQTWNFLGFIDDGKPDPAVYEPVMELLGPIPKARILAIGDSPHTDLAGAQAAGIDALWALTGLAGEALGADPSPAALAAVAVAEKVAPLAPLEAFAGKRGL
jgi:beta-phosphoglucomutase-like phosphatase (HAD superfamily)